MNGPSLTRITGLMGTPDYLAPEVAEHDRATAASDVYAAGILLYELLSGFTPFSGGHPVAVLRRHMEQDPVRPEGLPDELWDLVAAMLAKSPAARPSAADVARRLKVMAPRLAGLPALFPTRPAGPDETPTALRAQRADSQEAPTVLHAKLPPVAPKAHPSRRLVVIVTGVVAAAALAVDVVVATAGSPRAKQATVAFSPQSYPTGLIVDRTWTLSGKTGDLLLASATLTNGLTRVLHGHYDEVIPKQVAENVAGVSFSPTPDQIIKADPVVRYDFDLAAGASLDVTYRADVGKTTGSWSGRLAALAHDQAVAEAAYRKATSPTTTTTTTITTTTSTTTTTTTPPTTTTTRRRAVHKKPRATTTTKAPTTTTTAPTTPTAAPTTTTTAPTAITTPTPTTPPLTFPTRRATTTTRPEAKTTTPRPVVTPDVTLSPGHVTIGWQGGTVVLAVDVRGTSNSECVSSVSDSNTGSGGAWGTPWRCGAWSGTISFTAKPQAHGDSYVVYVLVTGAGERTQQRTTTVVQEPRPVSVTAVASCHLTAASVRPDVADTVECRAPTVPAGTTVTVQYQSQGTWKTIISEKDSGGGTFGFRISASGSLRASLRVLIGTNRLFAATIVPAGTWVVTG